MKVEGEPMPELDYYPMPVTVAEITDDWLTAALRQRAAVTVLGFEIVDVVHTTTTKIRIRLQLDDAGKRAGIPELIIVKGGFQPHGRELDHMHLREVRGYRDIYPEIPLPSPKCYFADFDAKRRQGIIIMADLVERGVVFSHATRPQTHEQVARCLSVLAAFHARTWDSPELKPNGKWGSLDDFFAITSPWVEHYAKPENWERLVATPRGVATSVRFHDRERMIDAWRRMADYGQGLPYCVLHGDVHLGNLYTDIDGTPAFLDTLACRGPAMLEIAYYISASVDLADRQRWEGALVRHYLDELARNGVAIPDFDEAMRQYAIFLIYGHFVWLGTESEHQSEVVKTANAARVSQAMLDFDTIGRISALPRLSVNALSGLSKKLQVKPVAL
jgi:hypothetical protein